MRKFIPFFVIIALILPPSTVYAANKVAAKKVVAKQVKTKSKATTKAKDYNCSDFNSWNLAQNVFLQAGGVKHDIYDLDRDHDGIACEDLQK